MRVLSIVTGILILAIVIASTSIFGIIIASEAGLSQTSNMSGSGSGEVFDQTKIGDIEKGDKKEY